MVETGWLVLGGGVLGILVGWSMNPRSWPILLIGLGAAVFGMYLVA